ncbi:hypothetical protein [Streptomyces sp. NPDC102462]|uniref:hypothetical protein n=1 Tax=Streptomyces sp. NPDC102462 TaxID=3366178 RepID=UPI003814E9B7
MSARVRAGAAVSAFAAAAAVLAGAGPAEAATTVKVTSNCDVYGVTCTGDLWMVYNSKDLALNGDRIVSSWADFYGNIPDFAGRSKYVGSDLYNYVYVFNGNGNGSGQAVKNNAASVRNCAPADNYRVYYNSDYLGHSQYFGHASAYDCPFVNLDSTLKNENASAHFA